MAFDIFISYSRKDYTSANAITYVLDKYGYTYFIDREGISAGEDIIQAITRAIRSCRLLVFLLSENSVQSDFAQRELAYASSNNIEVLPVRIDNSTLPRGFEFFFSGIQILDMNNASFEDLFVLRIGRLLGKQKNGPLSEEQKRLNLDAAEKRKKGASDYVPKRINVDVFISYRRVDGRDYARNIMQALKISGYPNVFFDYTSLRDGVFNTQIIDAIYSCNDFILVISPLALKNCGREGDWVAKEIRFALKYNKKIVPVVIEDTFTGWPSDFPEDLCSIKDIHFHKLMTDEYFEDSIVKLIKRLSTKASTDPNSYARFQDFQIPDASSKETLLYKIKVDKDCLLYIDDEEIQVIEASKLTKIPLPKGEYMRKVVDIKNNRCFDEAPLILDHEKVDFISLKVHDSFFKRILYLFLK